MYRVRLPDRLQLGLPTGNRECDLVKASPPVHWRHVVALACHRGEQIARVVEPTHRRGKSANGYRPTQAVERGSVRVAVDAEGADDPQFLQYHHVGHEPGAPVPHPRVPATTDGACRAREFDGLRECGRRLCGDVETTSASLPVATAKRRDGIVDGNVYHKICPEPRRERQSSASLLQDRSSSRTRPRRLGRRGRAQVADAGTEHGNHVPRSCAGIVHPNEFPAPSGLNTLATTGSSAAGTGSTIESGARY